MENQNNINPQDQLHEFYKKDNADIVAVDESLKQELIDKMKGQKRKTGNHIVYGIYNNANLGVWVRINDFLVDRTKVTLKDKSYFYHMLAVMVDAGIGLVPALYSLSQRTENQRFMRVLNTIAYHTEQGKSLSENMKQFEDVFDESEIGIVKSGEATGRLDDMLFKLSKKLDDKYELNMKLWGAAIYPIVVLGVLVVVATIMLVWVFPTLLSLFANEGTEISQMPLATRLLVYIQTAVVDYWWLILLILGGIYAGFTAYRSTESGRNNIDRWVLDVPIFGSMLRKVYVLRFVDMIGLLIDAGIPVLQVLEIVGNSFANNVYRIISQEIIEGVRKGEKISENMEKYELLFPAEVVQMIRVGEASASIGKVCDKISIQYQKEIDNALKRLTAVFEPVLIVTVGLFVALLAMAIMGPIFNLSSTLSS